jgi:hypothetical protein
MSQRKMGLKDSGKIIVILFRIHIIFFREQNTPLPQVAFPWERCTRHMYISEYSQLSNL